MSRVGQTPVEIPDGVEITISEGVLTAKGKLGTQMVDLLPVVQVSVNDGRVVVKPVNEESARGPCGVRRVVW